MELNSGELYRHGDRAPKTSYPNDPYYNISYWPDGLGQLVNQGKLRQFHLGKWLRKRYSNFIPQKYNYKDIYVRSSDVDRTLMSASANLAGLFYPFTSEEIWQDGLPWNPVPIHTVPEKKDEIISMSKHCDKFEKMLDELLASKYFKNVLKEHESIISIIYQNTGWNITEILSLQKLYTVLYIYRTLNPSFLPEWDSQLDQNELSYLAGLSFSTQTYTEDLQRLKVGPFINYLNNYFDGVINKTSSYKLLMLSGHDGTIAGVLNSLGAYDYHPPEFCSMVIWELRRNQTGNHYMNILYRKNSTATLKQITLQECHYDCEYNAYKNILEPVTVDSKKWKKECKGENSI
ncbi:hypothetical protein JTB14_000375 [Gonioctena quinquepunctata]|nr:hypothetical protein JTB14_000375 [Gonioctena quinquepunctata]